MKKLLILIVLFTPIKLLAQPSIINYTIPIYETKYHLGTYYYRIPTADFGIYYDEELEEYYVHYYHIVRRHYETISFTQNQIDILKYVANKFLEWEKLAIRNNAVIVKEIPNSDIVISDFTLKVNPYGSFKPAHNRPLVFSFSFVSREGVKFLRMSSNELIFPEYEYKTYSFSADFSSKQVTQLVESLSSEGFQKIVEEHKASLIKREEELKKEGEAIDKEIEDAMAKRKKSIEEEKVKREEMDNLFQ